MDQSALVARYQQLELLVCEAENTHVESQYQVSCDGLQKLESQLAGLKDKYSRTHAELAKQEHKDEQYNSKGPNLKKFGARITGQLHKKQHDKHELVIELKKKDASYQHDVEVLVAQVQAAKRRHMDLEQKHAELLTNKHRQDELLEKLFNGPCGSPQENQCEAEMGALHAQKHDIAKRKSTFETARQYLAGGVQQLGGALQGLRAAGFNNKLQLMDNVFDGGRSDGIFMDVMKQRRINQAKMLLMEAKQNLINAKSLVPELPRIDDANIECFGMLADMVFDGVIGDMMQQRRIRESMDQVENALAGAQYSLQWMDAVINQQINVNLQTIESAYFQHRKMLKELRLNLIGEMMAQAGVQASLASPAYQPVSSANSFAPAVNWTTSDISAAETQAREQKNASTFDLATGEMKEQEATTEPQLADGDLSEVAQWLQSISPSLVHYASALEEYGYDSLDALRAADDADLQEALQELEFDGQAVNVKKPHQRQILEAHKNMIA